MASHNQNVRLIGLMLKGVNGCQSLFASPLIDGKPGQNVQYT